ncbi:IS30 family transposase [Streptomyces sp. NPDC127038]|uniref:IS30 family transposase n=1 Tax=Streptomyces sp. NPDC127038 TaxID=3347114 RepID=UPI0036616608
MGARSQSAVATLVDRRTRYLRLVPLPEGHSPGQVRDALIATLSTLPEQARRSLTWDEGSEMARHHELAPYFTDGIFFARPGGPWERGTNENTYWCSLGGPGLFDRRGPAGPRRQPAAQQRALHDVHRPAAIPPGRTSTAGPPRAGQRSPRSPAHPQTSPDRRHPPRHDPRPSYLAAPHHPTPARCLT